MLNFYMLIYLYIYIYIYIYIYMYAKILECQHINLFIQFHIQIFF